MELGLDMYVLTIGGETRVKDVGVYMIDGIDETTLADKLTDYLTELNATETVNSKKLFATMFGEYRFKAGDVELTEWDSFAGALFDDLIALTRGLDDKDAASQYYAVVVHRYCPNYDDVDKGATWRVIYVNMAKLYDEHFTDANTLLFARHYPNPYYFYTPANEIVLKEDIA